MEKKDLDQAKRFILNGIRKAESEKFEKLKIELTKENEQKLREMYQFIERNIPFEKFINIWITNQLFTLGF